MKRNAELAQYISLMKKTLRLPSAFFLEVTANYGHSTPTSREVVCPKVLISIFIT